MDMSRKGPVGIPVLSRITAAMAVTAANSADHVLKIVTIEMAGTADLLKGITELETAKTITIKDGVQGSP